MGLIKKDIVLSSKIKDMCNLQIYSGIEPSKKGAGNFVANFIAILKDENINFKLNSLKTPSIPIIRKLKKYSFFKYLKELYYVINRWKTGDPGEIDTSVIFHPQSLGLLRTIDIIERSKKSYLYVLDNSFFCKRSYNYNVKLKKTCFECIKDSNRAIKYACESFPNYYNEKTYKLFYKGLIENCHRITFLTQNRQQEELIKLRFGETVNVRTIGMFTGEFSLKEELPNMPVQYDVLYHNTLSESKGIRLFVDVAKKLSSVSFVLPFEKNEVERVLGEKIISNNILFKACNWNTGLKELIYQSKFVMVPSLWSAPVESSLIKSLFYANCVISIASEKSFVNDIPNDICVKLPNDSDKISCFIENNLEDKKCQEYQKFAKKWLVKYVDEFNCSMTDFIGKM